MEFAELVETESRGLTAAVTSIVGDWASAEEIVQDAFERAFLRWSRVARIDRPGAWVRRVAINAAISSRRRRSSEMRAVDRMSGFAMTHHDAGDAMIDAGIWTAVRALPRDQAAAIALRYAADLSIGDISATMHLSDAAVKSLLHRGRATLRESGALAAYSEPRETSHGGMS